MSSPAEQQVAALAAALREVPVTWPRNRDWYGRDYLVEDDLRALARAALAFAAERQPAPAAGLTGAELDAVGSAALEAWVAAEDGPPKPLAAGRAAVAKLQELAPRLLPPQPRVTERELAQALYDANRRLRGKKPRPLDSPGDLGREACYRYRARAAAARLGVPLAPEPQQAPPEPRSVAAAEQPAEPAWRRERLMAGERGWLRSEDGNNVVLVTAYRDWTQGLRWSEDDKNAVDCAAAQHFAALHNDALDDALYDEAQARRAQAAERRAAELEERLLLAADALARAEQRAREAEERSRKAHSEEGCTRSYATRQVERAANAEMRERTLAGELAAAREQEQELRRSLEKEQQHGTERAAAAVRHAKSAHKAERELAELRAKLDHETDRAIWLAGELADLRGRAAAAIERLATPGSGGPQQQPAAAAPQQEGA